MDEKTKTITGGLTKVFCTALICVTVVICLSMIISRLDYRVTDESRLAIQIEKIRGSHAFDNNEVKMLNDLLKKYDPATDSLSSEANPNSRPSTLESIIDRFNDDGIDLKLPDDTVTGSSVRQIK